jgi:hypothetical protein
MIKGISERGKMRPQDGDFFALGHGGPELS